MIELTRPESIQKTPVRLSGSKSISNRLLILNEILALNLTFQNLSNSEDTTLLQNALQQLKNKTDHIINVHHAGTDMRFLTALLSVTEGEWTLTGSERMQERPIGELVSALKMLGAEINYLEKENFPPLLIKGKKLSGGTVAIDSSVSSQFVSALLLIAPSFEKGLQLKLKGTSVSRPYIEMTISLLKEFGVNVTQSHEIITLFPSSLSPFTSSILIESDWSSASYWYSVCALSQNSEIELMGLSEKSLQADSVLPDIYKSLGVKTTFKEKSILLRSINSLLTEFDYDFTNCPDIAQTLAVTCFGLGIKTTLRGLKTLKVKETDRTVALKNELEKCGAEVEITSETLNIKAHTFSFDKLKPVAINTYNDHRMAMSFAPLSLLFKSISIADPNVVNKSYPTFWEDLKSVGFNVNLQP